MKVIELDSIPHIPPAKQAQYIVFERLRDSGWIVRSGLNYGTDFVLYRTSPETEHAEYTKYSQVN